jgi:hypothetical protein
VARCGHVGRPNRGGGRGADGGPRPQCWAAALADK